MKFVMSLAFQDPAHAVALCRAAEQAGIDAVALPDHVVHPERIATPYPYTPDGAPRWPPFTPWLDPWVAIGHLSAVTERLNFLTGIFVLPLRSPFLVAKAVATASVLAGGRVVLGVGAGWMRDEFELVEQRFERRGRRMDEMIEVLRKLWSGEMVEHAGEFYRFARLEMSPAPAVRVPIWVGGLSEPALRRAARLGDGWVSDLHSTADLEVYAGKLRALREQAGRADEPFSIAASANDAFDLDGYRRLGDIGVTHLITMPWIFYGGAEQDLAGKLDGIRRFGDNIITRL